MLKGGQEAFLKNEARNFSMNDLYGIDPAAPNEARYLALIAREFRPSTGRFIADFPSKWFTELRANLGTLPAVKGMLLEEVCRRLAPHALLKVQSEWNPKLSWAENAMSISDMCKALIGPAGATKSIVQTFDDYESNVDSFPEARQRFIQLTPSNCVDLIQPLLANSPRLVLVDPYFITGEWKANDNWKPDDSRQKFLKLLLESVKKFGKTRSLYIYWNAYKVERGSPRGGECRPEDLEELKEQVQLGPEFDVQIKTYVGKQNQLRHPRYIIGKWGAISFDKGFDFRGNQKHQVGWVDQNVFDTLYTQFYEGQR